MKKNQYTITKLNKKRKVYQFNTSELAEQYRKLNDYLKKYYPNTANRNRAVDKIIHSLAPQVNRITDKGHYVPSDLSKTVVRGDIKDFFPSINKHELYKLITHSTKLVLTNNQRKLLADILFDPNFKGIPQGLAISSTFSEIYLEQFDNLMKIIFSSCIYVRYVDDFLLICPTSLTYQYDFQNSITGLLKKYNLELSSEKFEIKNLSQSSKFTFLGYQFSLNDRNLIISIADEKITKIQRRINTYFSEFLKYKSYTRLYFKLKNLFFGITTISTTATSKQRQGIPYSYEFITSFESIQLLINNIEYQLKKIKTLKSQQYQEIRKLYYPYLQKNITSLRTITKTLRFNYFNLSVKNLCDIIQSLDISFKYTKQSKQGLIHILFYLLYKNEH